MFKPRLLFCLINAVVMLLPSISYADGNDDIIIDKGLLEQSAASDKDAAEEDNNTAIGALSQADIELGNDISTDNLDSD